MIKPEIYDIIIVGGSFAGLTLAHHLPSDYRVLVLERKATPDAAMESTGLITQVTKDLIGSFVKVDSYITNQITTIGVTAPCYKKYFFSHTDEPWIYSTDTPQLIKEMSVTTPDNVDVMYGCRYMNHEIEETHEYPVSVTYTKNGDGEQHVRARFIVGADGAKSLVAARAGLSQNKKFLVGLEKVFYGDISYGPHSDATVYHFWFGEFSLGYGGWLSPTIINGKKAFRLGLATLDKTVENLKKLDDFVDILQHKNIIHIEDDNALHTYGNAIPIQGTLKRIHSKYELLLGDAAGFCGAFAADGIKGAVISGKIAGKLLPLHLSGKSAILDDLHHKVEQDYDHMMTYYKKQLLYRFIWDRMKRDRTFDAMYDVIAAQKNSFLNQFCDQKDKNKSLFRSVLTLKNMPRLMRYGWYIVLDFFTMSSKKL